jgi:hypothetical protein
VSLETRLRRAAEGIHRAVESKDISMQMGERAIERFDRFRSRKVRHRAIGAIVLVASIVALVLVAAWTAYESAPITPGSQVSMHVPTNIGTVTITNGGCTLDGTKNLAAGPFTVTVKNEAPGPRYVLIFNVGNDRRFELLIRYVASLSAGKTEYRHDRLDALILSAGQIAALIDAHDVGTISGPLDRGAYVISCLRGWTSTAGTYRGIAIARPTDLVGPIEVH